MDELSYSQYMIAVLPATNMRNKPTLVAIRLSHNDSVVDAEATLLIRDVGHFDG